MKQYQATWGGRHVGYFDERAKAELKTNPVYRGITFTEVGATADKAAGEIPKGVTPAQSGENQDEDGSIRKEPSPTNGPAGKRSGRKTEK